MHFAGTSVTNICKNASFMDETSTQPKITHFATMEAVRDDYDSDVQYLSDPEVSDCSRYNFERPDQKNKVDSSDSEIEFIPKYSKKFVNQTARHKKNNIVDICDSSDSDVEFIPKHSAKFSDQSTRPKENNIIDICDSSDCNDDILDNKSVSSSSESIEEIASVQLDPKVAELVRQQRYLKSQVARLMKLRALKAKKFRPDVDANMSKKIASAESRLRKVTDKLGITRPGQSPRRSKLDTTAQRSLNCEQSVTMERLQDLHESLVNRPAAEELAEEPRGLRVSLMRHQRHAIAWMLWRETQQLRGGILADDMGLGKTLTMIALVLASEKKAAQVKDEENERKSSDRIDRHRGGTLVVVPKSLISQWALEVKKRCKRDALTVALYHGSERTTSGISLARKDIVLTSYGMVNQSLKYKQILHNIRWRRIIIDEAHMIRNYKSRSCQAICDLVAETRWALSGTPIQNSKMDLFAILKFLQCSPFTDVRVWKRWIQNTAETGEQRVATILKALMLRRTKKELQHTREIVSLPEKSVEVIEVELDPEERLVYDKVMIFSRSLFAKLLAQKGEKARMAYFDGDIRSISTYTRPQFMDAQNKSHPMHTDVNPIVILVVLLRLRQLCCHPSLINVMLDKDDIIEVEATRMDDDEIYLVSEINKPQIERLVEDIGVDRRVTENLLTRGNPVFDRKRQSSKMRAVLAKVIKILETGDKQIIVSQWTSVIDIVADELRSVKGASFSKFTGKMTVAQRERVLVKFNSSEPEPKILLLSLKAGGIGLNLVGANHLSLIDVHWNPQLERQVEDRIYRLGQTKDIHIYKYICVDTIEERIKNLQKMKLELASALLSPRGKNSVGANKLSFDDLRMLFEISR